MYTQVPLLVKLYKLLINETHNLIEEKKADEETEDYEGEEDEDGEGDDGDYDDEDGEEKVSIFRDYAKLLK